MDENRKRDCGKGHTRMTMHGLRVLMTTDTVGGVWMYTVELAAGLQRLGAEVILAAMGGRLGESQWAQVGNMPRVRVFESDYRLEWMRDPWHDVEKAGRWLKALEKTLSPDIVHLNNYAHGALEWRSPVLVVGHSCVISWWHSVHGSAPPGDYLRYRHAVREGLQNADRVVAPSRTMRDALRRHYRPLQGAGFIYNGRDSSYFRPEKKEPMLLAVGRLWDQAKNIQAVAHTAGRCPWPVYVAGHSRHPDGGETVLPGVNMLGNLGMNQLRSWYGRAAMYVHPARYEPFGLSVLEAALSGCALVLGDIPTMHELWSGAAVFVDPDDHHQLRNTLDRLAENDEYRIRLGEAARRRASHFSLEAMVGQYTDLYGAMLGEADVSVSGTRLGNQHMR